MKQYEHEQGHERKIKVVIEKLFKKEVEITINPETDCFEDYNDNDIIRAAHMKAEYLCDIGEIDLADSLVFTKTSTISN